MIDRKNRKLVIEATRQYVGGFIDNDSYDDILFYKFRSEDAGLNEVVNQLWHCYDDLSTHKNSGKHRLSVESRSDIARYILFLQSDIEYRWPNHIIVNGICRLLSYPLTLGLLPYFADKNHRNKGPIEIWPFFTEEMYQLQLKNPSYLVGPS